ncbi:MAG TPA: hypothetical protein VFS43_07895 [Polyangiaceae bacterium]|nr:hypothetical protein [Polyangiaceae bacterium]
MRRPGRQPRRPGDVRGLWGLVCLALSVAAFACGHAPRVVPLSAQAHPPDPPASLPAEPAGPEPSDAECLAGLASPEVTPVQASEVLFTRPSERTAWTATCRGAKGGPIPCLLEGRYAGDAGALRLALSLYARTGSVAGPDDERWVTRHDGARAHVLPALPVGPSREQLDLVARALFGVNDVLSEIARQTGQAPRFRATGLRVRFFRPEGPADAEVYTSEGQLGVPIEVPPAPRPSRPPPRGRQRGGPARLASAHAHEPPPARPPVSRDDLVRALARLNDAEHGGWSARALEAAYRSIVARCGDDARCAARFDPRPPAADRPALFRPGGDPADYGAELVVRFYREQKAALARPRRQPPPRSAFKCAAPENGFAWSLVAGEFFAGFDRSAACP